MSADPLSRRAFNYLAVCAGAISVPVKWALAQEPSRVHCYIDQSGHPGLGNFWLGILISRDPEKHVREFNELRAKNRYTRVLRYRTTDKFKIGFCKDLIDYFVAEPELRFHGAQVSLRHWPDQASARNVVYFGAYRRVIESSRLSATVPVKVHFENRTFDAKHKKQGFRRTSAAFLERIKGEFSDVKVVRGFAAAYPLMQLTDFLTGSLRDQTSSKNKGELLNYLRNKLNVADLSEENLRNNQKFRVHDFTI